MPQLYRIGVGGPWWNALVVDHEPYEIFRGGLLRHITMEEKELLPEARRRRSGEPLAVAKQLRADHAALAALLVPTPTPAILAVIRNVLAENRLPTARPRCRATSDARTCVG